MPLEHDSCSNRSKTFFQQHFFGAIRKLEHETCSNGITSFFVRRCHTHVIIINIHITLRELRLSMVSSYNIFFDFFFKTIF